MGRAEPRGGAGEVGGEAHTQWRTGRAERSGITSSHLTLLVSSLLATEDAKP
jgi:hypothetical protein